MHERGEHTWREAAAAAVFGIFHVVTPHPDHEWAGGYGYDERNATSHVEVCARIGEHDVSVDTQDAHVRSLDTVRRLVIHELLWRFMFGEDRRLEPPFSVRVEAQDRLVTLSSRPVTFSGFVIAGGSDWTGLVIEEDVIIVARAPVPLLDAIHLEVARLQSLELSEHPPSP